LGDSTTNMVNLVFLGLYELKLILRPRAWEGAQEASNSDNQGLGVLTGSPWKLEGLIVIVTGFVTRDGSRVGVNWRDIHATILILILIQQTTLSVHVKKDARPASEA